MKQEVISVGQLPQPSSYVPCNFCVWFYCKILFACVNNFQTIVFSNRIFYSESFCSFAAMVKASGFWYYSVSTIAARLAHRDAVDPE
jgi:hypothetical protein